ncbi:MAG: hypothetical protein BGO77_04705 [Caedibacter sp. 37-49]|nr:MAG: hypothetical protein BGO77_04705 [Caedibacter sp. 37-49]
MKLSFFTVLTSSLLAGHSLQATDVLLSHQDSNRHTSSHCSPSSYGSSPKDFSDPHPGQQRTVHSAQIPAEEYSLNMETLWEGISKPVTFEKTPSNTTRAITSLMKEERFEDAITAYEKLFSLCADSKTCENFVGYAYTLNKLIYQLFSRAENELRVDIWRRNNGWKPQNRYIPALQKALEKQISICEELIKNHKRDNLSIWSYLTEALIKSFKYEKDKLKRDNLKLQIIPSLKIIKEKESTSKDLVSKPYENLGYEFQQYLKVRKKVLSKQAAEVK